MKLLNDSPETVNARSMTGEEGRLLEMAVTGVALQPQRGAAA